MKNNRIEVKKIDKDTYVLSENKHHEKTHAYLLIGPKKASLIDALIGVEDIKEEVKKLTNLPVIVYISHAHYDHFVGAKNFKDIYINENDYDALFNYPISDEEVIKELSLFNQTFPDDFDVSRYKVEVLKEVKKVKEPLIDLGNRKIKAILTPGHTPGSLSFYEKERGYLFAGDLIYAGELEAYYGGCNIFDYYASIKKIRKLNVKKIFTGHYKYFLNKDFVYRLDRAFYKVKKESKDFKIKGNYQFKNFSIHF